MRFPETGRRRSRTDLILLLVLVGVGVVVSGLGTEPRLRMAVALRTTLLAPFLELHAASAERARLLERLERLRAERDSLATELLGARHLVQEGRQLRTMFGLGPERAERAVAAELVPGGLHGGDSDVFLLRGPALEGIEPPAGAFTGTGLVGVVRAVAGDEAVGEFWTHADFRVSVRTEEGEITGIVRSAREEDYAVMVLDGAPYQEEIPDGTVLVTTGLAGVHPPGVRVGVVRGGYAERSGWARSYLVEPSVRPGQVTAVLVWRRASADAP